MSKKFQFIMSNIKTDISDEINSSKCVNKTIKNMRRTYAFYVESKGLEWARRAIYPLE